MMWDCSPVHAQLVVTRAAAELPEIGEMDRDEAINLLKGGQEGIAEWNKQRQMPTFSLLAPPPLGRLHRGRLHRRETLRGQPLRGQLHRGQLHQG